MYFMDLVAKIMLESVSETSEINLSDAFWRFTLFMDAPELKFKS